MPQNISIRSFVYLDRYIRHVNFLGELTPVVSELDKNDATFQAVPGLADHRFISFLSINFPHHYLRHQDFRLKLQQSSPPLGATHDALFAADATFIMQPGNWDHTALSFLSFNFPDRFIRHSGFHLSIDRVSGDELSKKDTTFTLVNGFIGASPHL